MFAFFHKASAFLPFNLPPPLNNGEIMMRLFAKEVVNLSSEDEAEETQLYDGIRFSRRQACEPGEAIYDCDRSRVEPIYTGGSTPTSVPVDKRKISNGTVSLLKYHSTTSGYYRASGSVLEREKMYEFFKDFREGKIATDPKEFGDYTAKQYSNGNKRGEFINGSVSGYEKKTIYTSSYDSEYKKCNVGNLNYANHSNDLRSEDYSSDNFSYFIPSLQSTDYVDNLDNKTCRDFFVPHMIAYGTLMGTGSLSCMASGYACSSFCSSGLSVPYFTKVSQRIVKYAAKISKKLAFAVKGGVFLAKISVLGMLDGVFFAVGGAKNTMECYGPAMTAATASGALMAPKALACISSNTLCTVSGFALMARTIIYYTELSVKARDANKVFQANQVCGSEWKTWNWDGKEEKWTTRSSTLQWDTESSKWKVEADYSYATCLKKLFTANDFIDRIENNPLNLSDLQYSSSGLGLTDAEIDSQKKDKAKEALANCQKYGNFINGKMNNDYDENGNIINNPNRKFDFIDNKSAIDDARRTNITNQYFREYVFNGIEYEDFGGCQNPYINHSDGPNIPQNKLADIKGIQQSIENLGYASVYQRYYLRGSASDGEEGSTNYACQRFKRGGAGTTFARFKRAYECCEKKARTAICIEQKLPKTYAEKESNFNDEKYKYKSVERGAGDNRWYDYTLPYKFCTLGETDCQVNNMTIDKQRKSYGYKDNKVPMYIDDYNDYKKTEYTIFPSSDKQYICAKTANLCPYDHYLGGGTEKKFESYDARSSDDIKNKVTANFCQYLSHCVKADIQSYSPKSPSNNYLSSACLNFIGDSLFTSDDLKNAGSLSLGGDVIIQRRARNLTAPMVQCLKETMENYLFNKRGMATCKNEDDYNEPEYLNNGICKNGALAGYEKGEKIGDSIFTKLRDRFKTAIKIALSLAIAIFALMMLFQGNKAADFLARKNLFPFILKISVVVFFTLSDSWERDILKNILDTPLAVAEIIFNPKVNQDPKVLIKSANKVMPSKYSDGCIFPPRNSDGSLQLDGNGNPIKYPEGKEYLRIFDTFDCKISRLLLYSPEANVPNFMKMILTGFFSGPLGFAFVISSMAFAFFMILIALRVTHLTIISIMVVSLLLYIAPIALLMMLFQRTKNIFDNWLKQLFGYMIQPVIVFAYLGLLLHVADKNFYGDAEFADLQNNYKPAAIVPRVNCSNRYDIYGRHIVVNDNVISKEESYDTNSNLCDMADSGIVDIDSANIAGINNPAGNNARKDTLQPFNITIYAFESLDHNKKRLELMIQSAIITYIFYKIFEQITILVARITDSQDSTNMLNKMGSAFMNNAKSLYKKGAVFEKASRDTIAKALQKGIISDTMSGIANTASDIQEDTKNIGRGIKSVSDFMGGGSAKKDSSDKDSGGKDSGGVF